ncbi:MAG: signal peptidase II [Salinibacterium sp.]|nr:signal peptidase II [Salinibacterium sp.]
MRAVAALGLVASLFYVADRVSKIVVVDNLVLGKSVPFIGDLLRLRYVENPGAAFSLGSGSTWVFAIIAGAVSVFIVLFARRIHSIAWAVVFGMLLGGTLGNLTDRLTREPGFGRGYVVDFFELWGFPAIFNIADVAIVSSMALFIILTIRGVGLDGTRQVRPRDRSGDDSAISAEPSDQR